MQLRFTARSERLMRKLDAANRRDADKALQSFARDPATPGLNFEKLQGHAQLYSIRVNRSYRIILRRDPDGNFLEIINVGPHDIYRTLRRRDG